VAKEMAVVDIMSSVGSLTNLGSSDMAELADEAQYDPLVTGPRDLDHSERGELTADVEDNILVEKLMNFLAGSGDRTTSLKKQPRIP
jgi:hypothetical protein